jgi:hypothetical protein
VPVAVADFVAVGGVDKNVIGET